MARAATTCSRWRPGRSRGRASLDASGLPLHTDNQTIVKERIFLDPANRNLLHDQVTTIDHAYTRPWTVMRSYNRDPDPVWVENNCGADNHYVSLGKETYFISADGYLMPTQKSAGTGFAGLRSSEVNVRMRPSGTLEFDLPLRVGLPWINLVGARAKLVLSCRPNEAIWPREDAFAPRRQARFDRHSQDWLTLAAAGRRAEFYN